MASTAVLMSVEEYLGTTFHPDRDYVDGRLEERNVGDWDHSTLQGVIYTILKSHQFEWGIFAKVEMRIRVAPTRFRIPDVCVLDRRNGKEKVPTKAPLLCVEVVSPDDRLQEVIERLGDYHQMGVKVCWVFDPDTEKIWVSTDGDVVEWTGLVMRVPGTAIELVLDELHRQLALE